MRLALLSNVTCEVLADMLREAHGVWTPAGFGGWMETALAVPDELKAFDPEAVFLLLDSTHAAFDPSAAEAARTALEAALPHAAVILPDLADLADGVGAFCDERMWKLASMPWSLAGLRAVAGEIDRLLRALKGERKKVLALDLDNTLWDGVIGEDGPGGIRPRADFQRGLRALRERGVLLVALSKNNAADVEPVWDDPRMVLRRDDFVDLRIDWNDKAANLSAAAAALNLGTDAFVFVDDSPAERARMAALRPDVAVAAWPVSARRLARLYFPRMRLTDEDRTKTARYRDEAKRRARAEVLSYGDYLKDLQIRTEIHPLAADEIPRVAQLSQKANQFNVCTNRYAEADLAALADDPSRLVLTAHVSDRFGDLGLVAFVQARLGADGKSAEIADWVMSCRAMNRRIEFAVERALEDELKRRGVVRLSAVWRRTAKNAPVADLFSDFGFSRVGSTDGVRRYVRNL